MQAQAAIGVTGLGVMGANLARNLARHGHTVAVHNRSPARTDALIATHGHEGDFVATRGLEQFVASLVRPRRVIIMVKAGPATDAVIDELVPLLEPGDIVVDAGNAHFADTRRRESALRAHGLHFVGAGVSGGEEGALTGPSIMPGGSIEAYAELGPLLESIAARVDDVPCCAHVGPDGAGHFVKMVHNGIEYADMQLIAEAYDLLRSGVGLAPDRIAEVFRGWNHGDLESYLIEITAEVLGHIDPVTGGPFIDVVADRAGQKGTGGWTAQIGLDLGSPVSAIAASVFARSLSGQTELRAASRRAALSLAVDGEAAPDAPADFVDDVRAALFASKVVAYAQGFDMILAGSREFGWNVDLGRLATIWRGGCIIRARFLDRIRAAYARDPQLPSLLLDPYFADAVAAGERAWRNVISHGVRWGIPLPGFSATLAHFDAMRRDRLPAALLQGLRDYFGAHTYERVDQPGSFHTRWSDDRGEERTS